jgi:mannose-6-phosphate isomerase-like protein (cupin superfamily)
VGPFGPRGSALRDLWQTGGPLAAADQGGDRDGGWELGPAGDGVAFVHVTLSPGHDPGDAGVHTTRTVDVGVVVSGALELALPGAKGIDDGVSTVLGRGDVVVQRGTAHRWRPVGDEPAVLVSVMVGVPGRT